MKPEGFWAALGFLTRLPIPETPYNSATTRRSLAWYPLVGLIIGACVSVVFAIAQVLFPNTQWLVGALTLAAWVAITGALHLDGLADTLDAWLGGLGDRKRSLEIMKDPHVGANAVVWMCIYLMLKAASIAALAENGIALAALLLAPAWARLSVPWLFYTTPYVRAKGLGSGMNKALSLEACLGLTLVVLLSSVVLLTILPTSGFFFATTPALALFSSGARIFLVGGILFALFLLARQWMLARLGGTTGDTAGALIELCELTFLLAFLALS
ncbi:Cobalamin synthase, alpha-ribazol-GDP exchange [gamma proteobacterium HdN1]|nr:Cobalamin synthase, alpha-ribazol-GDP exchange [gamma proteobacterium HdN1]